MPTPMDVAKTLLNRGEVPDRAMLQEFMANGGQNLDPVETAWCAAFVNSSLAQAGIEGTGKLNAKSFLDWGQAVQAPQQGDIAVFQRGDPNNPDEAWKGHVAFFDSLQPDGTIRVLGGNQDDMVSYKNFPPDKLLGYRRAPGEPVAVASGQPAPPLPPGREVGMLPATPVQAGFQPPAPAAAPAQPQAGTNIGSMLAGLAAGFGGNMAQSAPAPIQADNGDAQELAMNAENLKQKGRGLKSQFMPDIESILDLGRRMA